jgi:hypothetical protein
MKKNDKTFSKEYIYGVETKDLSKDEEISADIPSTEAKIFTEKKENNEDQAIKIETCRYGISKPKRYIIKGKIFSD